MSISNLPDCVRKLYHASGSGCEINLAQPLGEAWVCAQVVEAWVNLEVYVGFVALLVGSLQPLERRVMLTERDVDEGDRVGRNITLLADESLQLLDDLEGIRASPGGGVGVAERGDH